MTIGGSGWSAHTNRPGAGAAGAGNGPSLDDLFNRLQRFTSYDQNGGVTTSAAGSSRTLGVA
jgi:hypothetical protein